jgi:hypothetical protein
VTQSSTNQSLPFGSRGLLAGSLPTAVGTASR